MLRAKRLHANLSQITTSPIAATILLTKDGNLLCKATSSASIESSKTDSSINKNTNETTDDTTEASRDETEANNDTEGVDINHQHGDTAAAAAAVAAGSAAEQHQPREVDVKAMAAVGYVVSEWESEGWVGSVGVR